ncbi:hypothetical protein J0H58_21195 [bacterium]|nr:hypothetical protein [bacterium]
MKYRYLVLDGSGQLRKARQAAIRAFLDGQLGAEHFRASDGRELKLVTVVCDDALLPRQVYLLRLPLSDGRYTSADRLVLRAFACPECVTPGEAVRHHLNGWPGDLIRQLAVAMDVPAAGLDKLLDVGGPVLESAVTGLPARRTPDRLG